jgi:hypothetical protein
LISSFRACLRYAAEHAAAKGVDAGELVGFARQHWRVGRPKAHEIAKPRSARTGQAARGGLQHCAELRLDRLNGADTPRDPLRRAVQPRDDALLLGKGRKRKADGRQCARAERAIAIRAARRGRTELG